MLIVTVEFTAADPTKALALLHADTKRVRALPGNLAFEVLGDTAAPSRIVLLQRWQDAVGFQGHRDADGMKSLGAQLMPLMEGAPVTSVFEAAAISA